MKNLILDPVDLPTPDTNGEPPPIPLPDEPDIPNDNTQQFPGGPATPDTPSTGVPATRACGRTGPAGPPESFEAEVARTARTDAPVDCSGLKGGRSPRVRSTSASNPSCRDGEPRGGWLAVPADTLDLWDIDEDQ